MVHEDPRLSDRLGALHQDVTDLLSRVAALFQRAESELHREGTHGYADLTETISGAQQSVRDLELRMAVVAPMKAGKSTIVNALVGSDLVPSRAAAMTTLPTEIVLSTSPGHRQPTLTVDSRDRELFREAVRRIEDELDPVNGDPHFRDRMSGRYPYLAPLLDSIQEDWLADRDRPAFVGLEDIRGALAAYNDVARLAAELRQPFPMAERLHAVPRITAAHQWSGTDAGDAFGRLVLVDTPGPDEASSGLRLSEVLRGQLEKCSVILVVLDFTKLNSTAAVEIKETMGPALSVLRRDQLFAVVNKVDQRRVADGDMTRDQLRDFVIHDLDLVDDAQAADRVFEMVAVRALLAARVLDEIKEVEARRPGSFDPRTSGDVQALYELVHSFEWEELLAEASVDDVRKLAERARAKSGLDDFLRQAITVLRSQAGSRVLRGALHRALAGMSELAADVQLRRAALETSREAVADEIGRLDEDLRTVAEIRTELDNTAAVADKLRAKVGKILRKAQKECARIVQEISVTGEPAGLYGDVRQLTLQLRPDRRTTDVDTLEFDSVDDAQRYLYALTEPFIEQVDAALKEARDEAVGAVKERVGAEVSRHGARLKPILNEANRRLETTFDVRFDVPQAEFSEDIDAWAPIPVHSEQRMVEVAVEKTLRRRTWYTLWLGRATYREPYRTQERRSFHRLDVTQVRDQLTEEVGRKLSTMGTEFDTYLTDDLSHNVNAYYTGLNHYLQKYREALVGSLKDREREHDATGRWVERIDDFHKDLQGEITVAEGFRDGLMSITSAQDGV
ncbi:dynamin family protein [Streptomyces sp. NPDC048172]|uniref:dynamin family protein n=1 Tax=Streptomyces sp. NPDC048172 TaxID=3365505 RepID=UPI0037101E2A